MPDIKQMISEVAAENGIRIEPGDPLFALVTMNRMVFEESAQTYYESNQQLIAEFNESMKRAEMRAGSMLAQMVKESAEKSPERSAVVGTVNKLEPSYNCCWVAS